jgi:hypothetical protein
MFTMGLTCLDITVPAWRWNLFTEGTLKSHLEVQGADVGVLGARGSPGFNHHH